MIKLSALLMGMVVILMLQKDTLAKTERIAYRGWENCYRLSNDVAEVIVVPESGGRVLTYSVNGQNILYVNRAHDGKTLADLEEKWFDPDGGRFDVGPEAITSRLHLLTWLGAWEAEIIGDYALRIVSQPDTSLGIQLTREFTLDKESSYLTVRQTMRNISDHDTEWCFWSRTLTKGWGMLLVPLNPESKFPHGWAKYVWRKGIETEAPRDDRVVVSDGLLTVRAVGTSAKYGTDSSAGWMAYAKDGLLFVKRFRYFPEETYNDGAGFSVEIYITDHMCELEPLSPRAILRPNEAYSFTEHWWLLEYGPAEKLPFDLDEAVQLINEHTGIE